MTVQDIIDLANSYISDTSNDRLTETQRLDAVTEATAWLLEELGNEHMVNKEEIEFLDTVTWYKLDAQVPTILTTGDVRLKHDHDVDFTRQDIRAFSTMTVNRPSYTIERYNGDTFLGLKMPSNNYSKDIIAYNKDDSNTYTGINADNFVKEEYALRFDMQATGQSTTGVETTIDAVDFTSFDGRARLVFEIEIPDITDVTSVSLRFGSNLSSDYYLGTVTQDINGNTLSEGLNIIKIAWEDLTQVGTPGSLTKWRVNINHQTSKPVMEGIKVSDLRADLPTLVNLKYIFWHVGEDASGTQITEFADTTDVPFFSGRYDQYKFAVAHQTASHLFRSLRLKDEAEDEEIQAGRALVRYRKNFSGERDLNDSAFKVAGINFRRRKTIRRN